MYFLLSEVVVIFFSQSNFSCYIFAEKKQHILLWPLFFFLAYVSWKFF